jgi:hypothetical protein
MAEKSLRSKIITGILIAIVVVAGIVSVFYSQIGEFFKGELDADRAIMQMQEPAEFAEIEAGPEELAKLETADQQEALQAEEGTMKTQEDPVEQQEESVDQEEVILQQEGTAEQEEAVEVQEGTAELAQEDVEGQEETVALEQRETFDEEAMEQQTVELEQRETFDEERLQEEQATITETEEGVIGEAVSLECAEGEVLVEGVCVPELPAPPEPITETEEEEEREAVGEPLIVDEEDVTGGEDELGPPLAAEDYEEAQRQAAEESEEAEEEDQEQAPELGDPPVDESLTEETDEPETQPEPVVSCDGLENALSQAFYDRDWELYESVMQDLEDDECHEYCLNNFYWSVMYISLRDIINARDYYQDEQCTDCEMARDLNSYAAEEYSDIEMDQSDEELLSELTVNTLDYCPRPESFEEFVNSLIFDAVKYFGQPGETEANNYNRGFADLFEIKTAYAQSSPFSEDVESVLQETYDEQVEPEAEPQCRSLEIIRPGDAVGDMPVVMVPQTGFQDEELAIQVDADEGAVVMYRYRSLEGTITFDNEGTVYDTEDETVLMNHTDTTKGDIVSVWALNPEMQGIQECHDAFYVEFEEQEQAAMPGPPDEPEPAPATEPLVQPEPEAVAQAPRPQPQQTQPAPVQQPQAQLHGAPEGFTAFQAAPKSTSKTGPGFLYLIGAAAAGAYIKRKRQK